MRINLFVIFSFIVLSINAQKVRVFERGINFPIENVSIFNQSNSKIVYTDKNGFADLTKFKNTDILTFYHLSFNEFTIVKSELAVLEYQVHLAKKSEQLDEVVLSASKTEEKRSRIAEQIAITSVRDIKKQAPQTSADLLSTIPGIKVQKSQFGGGSPVLRGMEANRVLLVVDGVRMNNAIYRMGHLQNSITVSPNILERMEIIFGPSSVMYGSDALGGVIHYYTKTPRISDNQIINAGAYSRFSSANKEFTIEGNIEIRDQKWASFTSFSKSSFGELTMGSKRNHGFENWGKVYRYSENTSIKFRENPSLNRDPELQKNTDHNQIDLLQKLVIPVGNHSEFTFNVQFSESTNINRFDKLTEYSGDNLKFAEWYYGPQKRLLISSQLKINPNKKWLEKGTITAAYQRINESRVQRKFSSMNRSYRNEDVDVFSLNGDFSVVLSNSDNRRMSYGFEFANNEVNSSSYGRVLRVQDNKVVGFESDFVVQSRYPDGGSSYKSGAGYLNYRQDINKKSTLNTGIRFIHTNLQATWIDDTFITLPDFDISLNNTAVTATIGYAFKPSENLQWNSVVSSGFRSPNIDDVGKIREKSGKVTVPNIALKPEYAYNFETSVLKYFDDRNFQVGLNVYYTLLDNYITRDFFELNGASTILYDEEESQIMANMNKDKAYIVGSTFSFRGKIEDLWYTKGSMTYTKGKTYDTDEPLSSIPPLFGMLEFGFEKERLQASLNWRFNGQKKYEDYNLREGIDNIEQTPYLSNTDTYFGTPRWNTFGFQTSYKLSNLTTLFGNIDNIFDIHYKEFASSISAPGRNFSISIIVSI